MATGGELNMGAYRRVKPTKEQAAIAESNRRFLEKRDAGLSEEERAAAADAEAARRNNGRNPGGRMSDDQWIDTKWDDAMRQQRIDDAVKRRRDNAAYRATLDKAQANVESGISESRDRQMRANLAGFDKAFAGNGMVPMSVIDTLAGEMSETGVRYAGGRFFDGKNGDRTFVSVGLTKDGQKVYNRMSLIDALREDTRLGGGNLSDKTRDGIVAALRKRGMTDEQIERASGYSQRVEDEIRARYAETVRPEGDGNPDSITNRITGGAGGREVGSTTDGKAMSRIAGRVPSRHSRISFFGTGGAGTGWSRGWYDGHTGEYYEEHSPDRIARDKIAADPNHIAHFKISVSGPRKVSDAYTDENGKRHEAEYENGKLYRNEVTGEEIWVPEGTSLRQIMANAEGAAKGRYGRSGRPAEDQIAIDAAKHGNKMEELRLQEDGKNTRSAAKRDFDQKKLDATIKKWGDDLKVREKSAKTAEDKAALEKSRAQYNDFSKRIGVLSNVVNTPGVPKAVKDKARELLAGALDDDGMPNYAAIADEDNQAPIKPGDNTGDETQIPEFDPNKKDYKAGDHFVRNGIEYEVGPDGQPHKVSK